MEATLIEITGALTDPVTINGAVAETATTEPTPLTCTVTQLNEEPLNCKVCADEQVGIVLFCTKSMSALPFNRKAFTAVVALAAFLAYIA